MDLLSKSICLILSCLILLNAIIVKHRVGSWIFPSVIYSVLWFLYTMIPMVSLIWIPVDPWAIGYILVSCVIFSLGSLGSDWRYLFEQSEVIKSRYPDRYSSPVMIVVFVASFAGAVVCLIGNSITQGFTLEQLTENLSASAAQYTAKRYTQDLEANIYLQLSLLFAYLCSAVGGLLAGSKFRLLWSFLIVMGSFLPAFFVMLTQSAKGMLFLCIAIFFGSLILTRLQHGKKTLIDRRILLYSVGALAVIVPAVTASFLARLRGIQNPELLFDEVLTRWASYTSGHLFAFSDWFSFINGRPSVQLYGPEEITGGFYTFMSIFRALGDDRYVPLGYFGEFYSWHPYLQTNIYTYYRGLITDFGMLGSLLAVLAISLITHVLFRALLRAQQPALTAAYFVFFSGFAYQTFVISTFTWDSLVATLVLFGILLAISRRSKSRRVPNSRYDPLSIARTTTQWL